MNNKIAMPLSVKEWRDKRWNRKCQYCAWLTTLPNPLGATIYVCRAKDKMIHDILPDMTRCHRLFCKLYAVKEEDI